MDDTYGCSHLLSWILWMFLEGPGDSGLKRFWDAFQESAASLNTVELLLCHAMLMVVCRGQQRGKGDWWRSTLILIRRY